MSARRTSVPTTAEVADAAALLGVAPGSPPREVKRAWRSAVRVTHPDRVDAGARRAAEHLAAGLNEARDVLLEVAGVPQEATPFGARPGAGTVEVPTPPNGTHDHPTETVAVTVAPVQHPHGPAPDLPSPLASAGPDPVPGTGTPSPGASGRARPVRETIAIVILLALVVAAVILAVYQLLGGLVGP